jgi:hypothetical protein
MTWTDRPRGDTTTTQDPTRSWDDRSDRDDRDELTVYEKSEARRSVTTSEFWIYLVVTAGLLIAAYNWGGDSLSREEGWRYAAAITIGYLISRGLAKAGSSEPRVRTRQLPRR